MLVLWLTGILFCVVLVAWWWSRPRHGSPPVYPGALPIIGHAFQFIGDRKHLWNMIQKGVKYCAENGDVIEFRLGTHSCYMLTNPDDILEVSNANLKKVYIYYFVKDFIKNGLLISEASTWKTHRRLLIPAFNQQVINTFVDEINVQSQHLVCLLAAEVGNAPFDVRPYFIKHTLRTVSRTSLGIDDQLVANEETLVEAVEECFVLWSERLRKLWLHLSFLYERSTLKVKQNKVLNTLKNIMDPVIKKRKLALKAKKISSDILDSSKGKFIPIVDRMLHMTEEQGTFTDDDIRDHLNTFVAAAYDTTSTVMTYALVVIGSYPDVQERILEELHEVLKRENKDITKDDLNKFVFLEAVIKETVRLYNPFPVVGREIERDFKLKNFTLKAGSSCFLALYGSNRHSMWGADADTFRPERWLDPAALPTNPNAFAPFGLGKRNCIGKLYSIVTMKITLAHILRQYHVTSDISKMESEFDIILKPAAGHLISLKLRS